MTPTTAAAASFQGKLLGASACSRSKDGTPKLGESRRSIRVGAGVKVDAASDFMRIGALAGVSVFNRSGAGGLGATGWGRAMGVGAGAFLNGSGTGLNVGIGIATGAGGGGGAGAGFG